MKSRIDMLMKINEGKINKISKDQIQQITDDALKKGWSSRKKRPRPYRWKRNNQNERNDESWDKRFSEIQDFIERHKRIPKQGGGVYEKMYIMQIRYMIARMRKNKLSVQQEQKIQKLLLPYKDIEIYEKEKRANEFQSRLDSISSFIEENDRLPKYSNEEERCDYIFLSKQKSKLKSDDMSEARKEILNKFLQKHKHRFKQKRNHNENNTRTLSKIFR